MGKTLQTARHRALYELLHSERKKANLTQEDLARKIGRPQSFVATVEGGQRRIDVVEFLTFAAVIGFDPCEALERVVHAGHSRNKKGPLLPEG